MRLKVNGWPNWTRRIALERIQTLILAESPSPSSANQGSTQVNSSRAEGGLTESSDELPVRTARVGDTNTSERIAKKLGAGVLMGSLSGLLSGPTVRQENSLILQQPLAAGPEDVARAIA